MDCPIKRDAAEGVVEQVAAVIRAEEGNHSRGTPEGTRNVCRSGMKRDSIASQRRRTCRFVPVQLDWGRREVRIREPCAARNDVRKGFAALQTLYSPDMARHPDGFWGETT